MDYQGRDRASTVPIKLGRQAREILRKDRKGSLIWSLHCEASEKKALRMSDIWHRMNSFALDD